MPAFSRAAIASASAIGRKAQEVGLHAARAPVGARVGVNRQEQVGPRPVGDVGALLERHVGVGAPRLDDLDAGLPQQQLLEAEGDVERQVGFAEALPARARVVAAVPGVDHDAGDPEPELARQRESAARVHRGRRRRRRVGAGERWSREDAAADAARAATARSGTGRDAAGRTRAGGVGGDGSTTATNGPDGTGESAAIAAAGAGTGACRRRRGRRTIGAAAPAARSPRARVWPRACGGRRRTARIGAHALDVDDDAIRVVERVDAVPAAVVEIEHDAGGRPGCAPTRTRRTTSSAKGSTASLSGGTARVRGQIHEHAIGTRESARCSRAPRDRARSSRAPRRAGARAARRPA